MHKGLVLTSLATVGAVGCALGCLLAKATLYAERVEEEQYCRAPAAQPRAA